MLADDVAGCATKNELRGRYRSILSITGRLVVAAFGAFAMTAGPAWAGTVVQTFFLPMPEPQVRASLLALQSGTGSVMDAVTSIVVTGNNTRIYYDHWEDGYEVDIENPVQASTVIWGDNNPANGIAPGYGTDVFTAGNVISLRNLVPLPRNPSNILYDGRDKIGATKALVVSRASWATSPGTVLAGAVEVSSVRDFGLVFESPVGQNVSANSMFELVSLFVMASENGTTVQIDADNNGVNEITTTLNQGEGYHVVSGVMRGARVTASKPVQAHIITGDVGANYESRWYTLYPVDDWSDSYVTPVGTASDGDDTYIFLYNPGAATISVNYQTQVGSGTINVAAGQTASFLMPPNSGGRFFSAGSEPFFAIAAVGAEPTANNVHDWGFSLVPEAALTTQAVVGWGPGSSDLSANGSPVWVTATRAATVFVDYDGNPATGPLTDINGDRYDVQLNLATLESRRVFDPDRDQTGMKLYTLDGTLITAAWGQDPATALPGNPFLDLGTTVLPLPVPIILKSSRLVIDADMDGLVDPVVDVLEYTIRINNEGFIILGNVLVLDTPPAPLIYELNSTTVDGTPIPDDGMGTPFPLDAPGYVVPLIEPDGFVEFKYRATVQVGATSVQNSVSADGGGRPVTDDEIVPVDNPGQTNCTLSFTDSGGSGVSIYIVGQSIYVTVTDGDANTSPVTAESITVLVSNPSTLDNETVTLTETGANTGVFRNGVGFPFSTSSGLSSEDGTLYALVGDSIDARRTDPVYGDQCSDTATISPVTETKYLYLDTDGTDGDATGDLDRVNPALVAPPDTSTSNSMTLSSAGTLGLGNAAGNGTSASGASSLTISSYSPGGSGSDKMLLVGIALGCTSTSCTPPTLSGPTAVTYGGTGLTQVATGSNTDTRWYIYRLDNPAAGPANIVITPSGTGTIVAGAMTFTNVNLSGTPLGTVGTATGTSTAPQVNVSTAAGDKVFGVLSIDSAPTLTVPPEQTTVINHTCAPASSNTLAGAVSYEDEDGDGTALHSYTSTENQEWAIGGVAVKPNPGGATVTFTQTPSMASTLNMPAGGAVSIVSCINIVSGTMPGTASVTATLKRNLTTFFTDTTAAYTASDAANCNGGASLAWSGALGAAVNVAAGEAVVLEITTAQAGVAFQLQYDSDTKISKVSLPTTTVINVDSLAVYDAAYAGGGIVTTGTNGQTYYVRAQVSDPFGAADITSLALAIDGPGAACDLTVDPVAVVNTSAGTKTFEYAWVTGACEGNYSLVVTAREGHEGTVTDTAATSFTLTALDLGTPSITEFTTGNNGPPTLTYAPDEQVCMRVTDLDQNTNPALVETITVLLSSSPGGDDEGPITLLETGVNTGVFTACLPASSTIPGMDNDGTIHAPIGSVLTVTYVDPTDPTDTSSDTATVPGGGTSVAISKTRVTPSDLVAVVGESVRFDLTITNNGAAPLPTVTVTDTFPVGCLTFSSASPAPDSTMPAGTLTWNDISGPGSLAPGASFTISVHFVAGPGTCSPALHNSASVSGTASAGPATAPIEVTRPQLSVNKTRTFPPVGPAPVGTTVTFTISVTNTGTTAIDHLPLEDNHSTCLQFSGASIAPDAAGGGAIVWHDLTGMGSLAPLGTIHITVNFTVVGACAPATNVADVSYADDVNDDPVPPRSASATIDTVAATISGQVRNDTDGDGDFADPDSGIPGVTVRLFTDPNGDGDPGDGVLVGLTVTSGSGNYTFTNLGAGDYTVVQDDLPAYYSTADTFGLNDNRIPVKITTITAYPGNDFLDSTFQSAQVNGRVYHDVNGDGDYDPGIDVPQEGVAVAITDAYGIVHTVITNVFGLWSKFVPPGNTTIDVDESTLVFLTDPVLTTNVSGEGIDSNVVYAPQGGSVTDNNGYIEPGAIGAVQGRVYQDLNADGDYDPGIDVPLNGVEVRITTSNGGVYTVFTDFDGLYSQVAPPGATSVDVVDSTLPPGGSLTVNTLGEGTDPTLVMVIANSTATDNTGYTWPATMGWVSGVVYLDTPMNGLIGDLTDVPLAGIDVKITDALGNVHVVTTDANGYFLWPVPPGITTVDVVDLSLPPRATLTIDTFHEGNDPTVVVVPPGLLAIDNTGYVIAPAVGFVAGTIFEDLNGNGTYQAGVDYPLSGVDVLVTDANGGVYVLTTDAAGRFLRMVPAGITIVDVDDSTLPAGASLAPGGGNSDPTTVVVPGGGTATDNTGYLLPPEFGVVQGTIYLDNDGSGTFNAGDTVLPNVGITITDVLGNVHTVTTDGTGFFSWPVPAGNTTVDVVEATLPVGVTLTTDANNEGCDPTVVFVPSGGTGTDNTGYVESPTGMVAGVVFQDVNGNGTYQAGTDIPLSGVHVTITDSLGAVHTVTTDGSGYFSRAVAAGSASVDVVDASLPAGATLAPGGGNSDPTTVTVPASGTAIDNTGYVLPPGLGAVNGTIYLDNDGSGTLSVGDTPLASVAVLITDSLGGTHTVTTNGSGFFSWPVPPGATTVDVVDSTLPPGVTLTTNGSNQGSDPTTVHVPPGGTATDNTGYVFSPATGTVDGVVFHDTNGNGTYQTGIDIPLSGVDVLIADVNGGLYVVTTDANGYFSRVVPAGNTTVDVVDATLPAGATLVMAGGNSDPTTVLVPPGGTATDNTGYAIPASSGTVSGRVYLDNDGSGTFNAGDTVLPNVAITITDSLGNTHTVTTNGSGQFLWPVPPGATTVDVVDSTLPVGATLTTDSNNEGSDPTVVNVPAGGTAGDNTGYVIVADPGVVSGVVFLDNNANGTYQPGIDSPLAGVAVRVTSSSGGVYSLTTNSNGYFSQVVPPGTTNVDVVDSTLPPGATLVPLGGNSDPTDVSVPARGSASDDTAYALTVPTSTATATFTHTPINTNTPGGATPTATRTRTFTRTSTPTRSPTGTRTPTPTRTATSTQSPTGARTFTPTRTPNAGGCAPSLRKVHAGSVNPGGEVVYTITWTNPCRSDLTGVKITDALPTGLTLVSASSSDAAVSVSNGVVTIDVGTLKKGPGGRTEIVTDIADDVPADTVIQNQAVLTDDAGNHVTAEDSLRVRGTPVSSGRLSCAIRAQVYSRPGTFVRYTARYKNGSANNSLALTLAPANLEVLETYPPPAEMSGPVIAWTNLATTSGLVKVDTRVSLTAPDGASLPARIVLDDGRGNVTVCEHQSIVRRNERISVALKAQSKTKPGRTITYVARYANVVGANEMTLVLPPGLTVFGSFPAANAVRDNVLTFSNLPVPAGLVKVRASVGAGASSGELLAASVSITDVTGDIATSKHSTVVSAPGSRRGGGSGDGPDPGLSLTGQKSARVGSFLTYLIRYRSLATGQRIHLDLPPGVTADSMVPRPTAMAGGRLTWSQLNSSGNLKVEARVGAETTGPTIVAVATLESSGATVATASLSTTIAAGAAASGGASLVLNAPRLVTAGLTADVSLDVRGLAGSGALRLQLPPEMRPQLTIPAGAIGSDGQVTWSGIESASGGFKVRVLIDRQAVPGSGMRIDAELTDGAGRRATANGTTTVR